MMTRRLKTLSCLTGLSLLMGLQACAQSPDAAPSKPTRRGEPVGLLLQGYNYTDDYIDSFTVNGQGGGNVFVSSPTSGGGKSVCCVSYAPGTPLPMKVRVRWVSGYCSFQETSPYGRTNAILRNLWSETEALVDDRSDGHPYALEIHIYPDQHVAGSVTRGESMPRVILPRNQDFDRPGAKKAYPQCSNDVLNK